MSVGRSRWTMPTMKLLMCKRLFPRDIFREEFFDKSDKAAGGMKSPLLKR